MEKKKIHIREHAASVTVQNVRADERSNEMKEDKILKINDHKMRLRCQ